MKIKSLERRGTCLRQRYMRNIRETSYIRHSHFLIWRWDPEPSLTSDGLWVTRTKWGCSLRMAVRAPSRSTSQAIRGCSIRGKGRWGSDEGAGSRGNEGRERYEEPERLRGSRGCVTWSGNPGIRANAHAHLTTPYSTTRYYINRTQTAVCLSWKLARRTRSWSFLQLGRSG